MAQTLLIHPVHGSKFALSDAEIEHDEQFGWVRYTDEEEPQPRAPRKGRKAKSIEQPNDVPKFLAPVSEESEGV